MGLLFTQAQLVSDKPRDFGSASLFHELFKRTDFSTPGLFGYFPHPGNSLPLLNVISSCVFDADLKAGSSQKTAVFSAEKKSQSSAQLPTNFVN